MGSYNYGKPEVCAWIRAHFPPESTILDVGACDGKWRYLLKEYENMDAIDAFKPNTDRLRLLWYRNVFLGDVMDFRFERYDLILLGDVLEHLTVPDAQALLRYCGPRCRDMVISVPYLYPQDAIYGNPYEVHRQADLTADLFEERYPGYEILWGPEHDYCYYHKGGGHGED